MPGTSVIRHRVVLAWADLDGPFHMEFYVQCAQGGLWEVFVGRGLANARARYIDSLTKNEEEAFKSAAIRLAYPVENEPKGLVPKVFEVVGLSASVHAAGHFFAVDRQGDVAMASLGPREQASDVCVTLIDENSSEAVSQAEVPRT